MAGRRLKRGLHLMLCLLLAAPAVAMAESAFIIDRVEAGLHESQSLDSPIIELLPTGSELEILQRNGNRVQVRTGDDTVGWIDERFLMPAKPTRQLLNETEAELQRTRAELEQLREEQQPPSSQADLSAKYQQLQQTRDRLQEELANKRDEVAKLRARVNELEKSAAKPAGKILPNGDLLAMTSRPRYLLAAGAGLLLLGMLLGVWLLDYRHRRRHGGFRV